jgi:hypothetical protein
VGYSHFANDGEHEIINANELNANFISADPMIALINLIALQKSNERFFSIKV